MGQVLELGPERNVGAHRMAELRSMAAPTTDGWDARHAQCAMGFGRVADYGICIFGGKYIPLRAALIRRTVNSDDN